jgi:hypothetical protein
MAIPTSIPHCFSSREMINVIAGPTYRRRYIGFTNAGGIHPLAGKAPWHSNEGLPNTKGDFY